jgi:hypothetical protein
VEAPTAAQISTIALGSTTFKNLQQIHDLRSAGHLDGGNIVNGGVRLLMYQQEKAH